ncbi:cytochrome b/b6 domain-containing protein [Rhizobacter sp. P5_C2]
MSTPDPGLPPRWVRATHWIHVASFFTLLASGWQIYAADPFWVPAFPEWATLGGSLPGALQWHFAAMWVFVANGLVAVVTLVASGRLRRLYLSVSRASFRADVKRFVRNPLDHGEGGRNAIQKLAYLGVLVVLALEVASGLSLWKPVQFQALSALLGGYEMTRRIHFTGMALLACFVAGHVALALASPQLLLPMLGLRRKTREETR